ncbi:probable E3 ubiquitin-protein ligase TRIML1 [Dromiciops gliroides]|uniref:probable E3 ubiquitin-protein ligase TRIML1 n=1 Tax=Dromiciops gliroides TaxID=33562 RepID=UPI001CC6CC0A|nr:probable E3 ubiquitin-protein ligase TRIML1 [Dromiciops gliroides]
MNSGAHKAGASSKSSQVDLEASKPGGFTPSLGDPQWAGLYPIKAVPSVALKSLLRGCYRKEAVGERRMASAMEVLQKLQKEITCGICRRYFSEPVTIECGHSFCQACLSLSWRVDDTIFCCPECRQVPQVRELPAVNGCLSQLTEVGKALNCQFLQSAEGQHQCAVHKKVLKLFCEDDQTAVCVRCSQSPEHETHVLSPIEETAHRFREKLEHILTQMEKHVEEAETLFDQEEGSAVDWHWMISGEYYRLHEFLKDEEFQYLEKMRQEKKKNQDRISQHMHTLQGLIQDLQEAGHQPNVDLLQDVKQLHERSESLLSQRAKAITPELTECPISGMIEMMRQFRVDITLDPLSASPRVTLSEDQKSVKAGEGWQVETEDTVDSPCHYVFAEQAFSSGRQYWEVDISQLPQWILGIQAPYSRGRRGRNVNCCASVFLLRCVKKEDDYYLRTYPGSLNHRVKSPVPRVGVYLEYTPGTLVFYNILQRCPIYSFSPIRFIEPVTPFFSPGPPLRGTKAGPLTLCPVD